MTSRLVFDPAVPRGQRRRAQRARARNSPATPPPRPGAAAAEQRRRKARQAMGGIPAAVVAQANATDHAASPGRGRRGQRHGYRTSDVRPGPDRPAERACAAISREEGLHKDWLSRHLGAVDRGAAAAVLQRGPAREDARGCPSLAGWDSRSPRYLPDRHLVQHRTMNAIAAEVGLTHHAVGLALSRHGVTPTAHPAKRHAATNAPHRWPPARRRHRRGLRRRAPGPGSTSRAIAENPAARVVAAPQGAEPGRPVGTGRAPPRRERA